MLDVGLVWSATDFLLFSCKTITQVLALWCLSCVENFYYLVLHSWLKNLSYLQRFRFSGENYGFLFESTFWSIEQSERLCFFGFPVACWKPKISSYSETKIRVLDFLFLRSHVLKYGGFGCLVAFLIWVWWVKAIVFGILARSSFSGYCHFLALNCSSLDPLFSSSFCLVVWHNFLYFFLFPSL